MNTKKTQSEAENQPSCLSAVMPRLFFVVARTSEEGWEQLSVGLPTYERAVAFRDEPFTKKRYPYAFVVCTINEA